MPVESNYDEIHSKNRLIEALKAQLASKDREITRLKSAQPLSKDSRFELLFNSMSEGFALHEILLDSDGNPFDYRFLEINPAFERLTGLKKEAVIGRTVREVIPNIEIHWIEAYAKVALGGKPVRIESYSSSLKRWYEVYAYCPKQGQFAVLFSNITERKEAEDVIRQSLDKSVEGDRLLKALMEYVPEGITIADKELNLVRVSRHGQNLLGIHEGMSTEAVARGWKIYEPDGQTPMAFEDLPVVQAIGGNIVENFELVQVNESGQKLPLLCNAGPIRDERGAVVGGIVAWRDITDRKQSEQDLQESQQRLQLALEAAYLISFEWDIQANEVRRFVSKDQALAPTTDQKPSTFEAVCEIVHPEDRELFEANVNAAIDREDGRYENEFRIVHPDGQTRWLLERGYVERDTLGKPLRLIGLSQDITDRKQSGETLLHLKNQVEAEKRNLEAILESLPVGVVVTDVKGGILLTNNMDEKIWGKRPKTDTVDDYVKYKAWWVDSGKPVESHEWAAAQAVLQGKSVVGQVLKIERFDGRRGYVHNSAVPIRDAEDRIVGSAVAIQDVTELRKSQEALQQLNAILEQRVVERTELAERRAKQLQMLAVELIEAEERERRRIAELLHEDLQQILAAARFQIQTLRTDQPNDSTLKGIEQLLEDSISKSRSLSHELSPPILHQTDFVTSLQWLSQQMEAKFGLHVHLETDAHPELETPLKVFLFRSIQELLINIVKHAGAKSAFIEITSGAKDLVVNVSDQGKGFDSSIVEFPTAKVGFGLLAMKERASYIGGNLEIESAPGKGCRVTITVPTAVPAETPKVEIAGSQIRFRAAPADLVSSEVIKVLLVDDHEVMRQGLVRLINGKPNFEVIGEAGNGREAIEKARKLTPDAILMDISMPEMDGIEATRRIKSEMPDVRVIGLSMFADDQIVTKMKEAGAESFVCKTASSADMLKAIYGIKRQGQK